jgi:methylmalonyl-CoA mutase C-terminal domain/subunit
MSAVRVLATKLGLDGHDRGLRLISRELTNRGAEVVYLGISTGPADAAAVAIQEDVDVIAVSLLSGSHLAHIATLLTELRQTDADIPVVCGGLIPPADVDELIRMGVSAVRAVGTPVAEAAQTILDVAAIAAVAAEAEAAQTPAGWG